MNSISLSQAPLFSPEERARAIEILDGARRLLRDAPSFGLTPPEVAALMDFAEDEQ